jgi:hypothetical protein
MAINWQPIETAPKDEKKDLLVWQPEEWEGSRTFVAYWYKSIMGYEYWQCAGGYSPKPTHWAQLNEPEL